MSRINRATGRMEACCDVAISSESKYEFARVNFNSSNLNLVMNVTMSALGFITGTVATTDIWES